VAVHCLRAAEHPNHTVGLTTWSHTDKVKLPDRAHLFGTNDLGQDLFSNWLWDARASLVVAALVALVSTALAWAVGLTTGTDRCFGAPLLWQRLICCRP
jgi:ABC-type dipeptide/oligopeptide/nickel transport system permease subunit